MIQTCHIASPAALQAYIRESLAYSALKPDVRDRWIAFALHAWYLPLLRDGMTNVPFHVALDMGCRTTLQSNPFAYTGKAVPDASYFQRYTRTLDRFCHEVSIRELIADIALHEQASGIVAFLTQALLPVSVDTPVVVAIDEALLDALYTFVWDKPAAPSRQRYGSVIHAFIDTFDGFVSRHTTVRTPEDAAPAVDETTRRVVLGHAMQQRVTAYPDLELIERCLQMDDPPPLEADYQAYVVHTLQHLRLEIPLNRNARPEGGYIGIRNNGGLEEMSNPVISEWANPPTVLWEKLTNKRLLIYERAANTISVRRMLLHETLIAHSRFLQIDADTGHLPYREAKYLIAAIARDLGRYLGRLRTIAVQFNIHIVAPHALEEPVRSVPLSDLPYERIKAPCHFWLDHRETFPWFFSSDLVETPAFETTGSVPDGKADAFYDITEALFPERDIAIGAHVAGFENAHFIVACTEEHYRSARERMVAHAREYLDLSHAGLDSLIFVVWPVSSPERAGSQKQDHGERSWSLEIVQQFHRSGHPYEPGYGSPGLAGLSVPMSGTAIRDRIRRYVLARLMGARFRIR